jgi:hypothetical protein
VSLEKIIKKLKIILNSPDLVRGRVFGSSTMLSIIAPQTPEGRRTDLELAAWAHWG